MSTMAWLLWSLVFGSIGLGYFMYGKKRPSAMALVCGIALMVYPYFVGNAWLMVGLGVVLSALPFLIRR